MSKLRQSPAAQFKGMPEWLVARLPEPRRTLHRKAIETVMRHEAEGTPFVLMLRTYGVVQLFSEIDNGPPHALENLLFDGLKGTGAGFLQVQVDDHSVGNSLYDVAISTDIRVHAPSLFIDSAGWLEQVTYLIERAECIVVLLSLATPGVVQELETILAAGRADRTVVLVAGEEAGGAVDNTVVLYDDEHEPDFTAVLEAPILTSFPRVLWVGDLTRPSPLETFVFRDLVERLKSIEGLESIERKKLIRDGNLDRGLPVTWKEVRRGFEDLAMASRAARRSHFAAQYFARVAMLAKMEGDVHGAIEAAIAEASLLLAMGRHQKAQAMVAELIDAIEPITRERWSSDSELVLAHARLVAEQARLLIPAGELDGATRILADEWARCQSPLNRRALSTLCTMTAWVLRATTDVDGVMSACNQAFELAMAENAPWEMARALTVLGATLDDLGEFVASERTLRKAAEILPPGQHFEDAFLIRMRLATVLEHNGRVEDARSMLEQAARVAEEGMLGTWAGEAQHRLSNLAPQGEAGSGAKRGPA
jgi:tetratricopeptide (TPR) repeat protein